MNSDQQNLVGTGVDQKKGAKPYSAPVLTLFGHVAALTRSALCSNNNDSVAGCINGGNMNPGSMAPSDRRLKQDIVRVGEHPFGIGLYVYRYRPEHQGECGSGLRLGVMADEVKQVLPSAVQCRADGYMTVDYDALGIRPWARSLH